MEWKQNILFEGKQVQLFIYYDICPIKIIKAYEDKICQQIHNFIL
ncbi:hypothetical protein pb186bvf_020996 [Paramecium bursaria]